MSETAIMRDIRAALNNTGRVRLYRNNVGVDMERGIRYGMGNGSPDLIGWLRSGRAFAIEVKTPAGRLSADQKAWWVSARSWGVQGGVARSVSEALVLLDGAEL